MIIPSSCQAVPVLTVVWQVGYRERMKTLTRTIIILLSVAAVGVNTMRADQPHMRRALEHLRAARAELQSAEHNKGGWRLRAIANTDRAIHETEAGMNVGGGR